MVIGEDLAEISAGMLDFVGATLEVRRPSTGKRFTFVCHPQPVSLREPGSLQVEGDDNVAEPLPIEFTCDGKQPIQVLDVVSYQGAKWQILAIQVDQVGETVVEQHPIAIRMRKDWER
jgi:hypothetical protein